MITHRLEVYGMRNVLDENHRGNRKASTIRNIKMERGNESIQGQKATIFLKTKLFTRTPTPASSLRSSPKSWLISLRRTSTTRKGRKCATSRPRINCLLRISALWSKALSLEWSGRWISVQQHSYRLFFIASYRECQSFHHMAVWKVHRNRPGICLYIHDFPICLAEFSINSALNITFSGVFDPPFYQSGVPFLPWSGEQEDWNFCISDWLIR